MNSIPDLPSTEPSLADALDFAEQRLAASPVVYGHGTDNPWDEAVQLVLAACGLPADSDREVLAKQLTANEWEQVQGLLQRRIVERIPLPYLLGKAWFAGLEFLCDSRALVPRSPLGELIIDEFRPWYCGPPPERILDLCCGGGCIGIAAAVYQAQARVDLLDLDPDALALAADNIALHGLQHRVSTLQSDLFAALGNERYDLILANPPYVDSVDLESMPAEFRHEPAVGLGSGPDGLAHTRRILAQAASHLNDQGLLVVEVGNSWEALENSYPDVPFTWLELRNGGHGVFALTAAELQEYAASLRR
jgi:ribosomal protein L3 glutamine methyltransferase